jgi:hypothetical protein
MYVKFSNKTHETGTNVIASLQNYSSFAHSEETEENGTRVTTNNLHPPCHSELVEILGLSHLILSITRLFPQEELLHSERLPLCRTKDPQPKLDSHSKLLKLQIQILPSSPCLGWENPDVALRKAILVIPHLYY